MQGSKTVYLTALILITVAELAAAAGTLEDCSLIDDPCTEGIDFCVSVQNEGSLSICNDDPTCFCFAFITKGCSDSNDCARGEACAEFIRDAESTFCVACDKFSLRNPQPIPVDDDHICGTTPTAPTAPTMTTPPSKPTPVATEPGEPTETTPPSKPTPVANEPAEPTVTTPPKPTAGATEPNAPTETTPPSNPAPVDNTSPTGTDSPSTSTPSSDGRPSPNGGNKNDSNSTDNGTNDSTVCIAVNALAHLPTSGLVFPTHRQTSVLCDKYGSCATPGHIVVQMGQPMMMRSYCSAVESGCTRKIMLVNSPRMARSLRVPSKSPELEFTALAARYETGVEEVILSGLVRAGL